ncbi:MAG: NAD(+) synthase [Anaerolineales bacterium]|jgi:NAD+ synthase
MSAYEPLKISASEQAAKIERFLRSKHQDASNADLLIGLSGGLDSTLVAYLAVRAVGAAHVHLLNITETDSSPVHQRDAQYVACELGIPLQHIDMTSLLKKMGVYRLLPLGKIPTRALKAGFVHLGRRLLGLDEEEEILKIRLQPPENSFISRGNAYGMAKHRMRMLLLYQKAEIHNDLVVGAANRTEWLTGTFAKWGCDHCADLMPLLHLYRSQVEQLARYVGVPDRILEKPADPDILPGVNNKEVLLGSFEETDQILIKIEAGYDLDHIRKQHDPAAVSRTYELYMLSAPMRHIPFHLDVDE